MTITFKNDLNLLEKQKLLENLFYLYINVQVNTQSETKNNCKYLIIRSKTNAENIEIFKFKLFTYLFALHI